MNPFLEQTEIAFSSRDAAYDHATRHGGVVVFVPDSSEPWVVVQEED